MMIVGSTLSQLFRTSNDHPTIDRIDALFGTDPLRDADKLSESSVEYFVCDVLQEELLKAVREENKKRHRQRKPLLPAKATGACVVMDTQKAVAAAWGDTSVAYIEPITPHDWSAKATVLSHPAAAKFDEILAGRRWAYRLTGNTDHIKSVTDYIAHVSPEKFNKGPKSVGVIGRAGFNRTHVAMHTFDLRSGGDIVLYTDGLVATAKFLGIRTPWLLAKFYAEYQAITYPPKPGETMVLHEQQESIRSRHKLPFSPHEIALHIQLLLISQGIWPNDLPIRSIPKADDASVLALLRSFGFERASKPVFEHYMDSSAIQGELKNRMQHLKKIYGK
jgi:hypothetical protein